MELWVFLFRFEEDKEEPEEEEDEEDSEEDPPTEGGVKERGRKGG